MMYSITTLSALTLFTLLPSSLASAAAGSLDHPPARDNAPPSFIELPLVQQHIKTRRTTHNKRTPGWLADNLVNLKNLIGEDELHVDVGALSKSSSNSKDDGKNGTSLPDLLQTRIADLSKFNWIKNRVSSKWSQKGNSAPSPSSSTSNNDEDSNEAFKRANKRPFVPVNVELETPSSNGFKKVVKRQDEAPATPAPAQPTLATTRGGASNGKIKTAKVPLIDDVVAREDIEYLVTVEIGTPPQSFNLILDTGSSDTWVQSNKCSNCSSAPTFNIEDSSSDVNSGRRFEIYYGIGSTSGDVHTEEVDIGGMTAHAQSIAVADQMSADWMSQPASGILGMGFQTNSKIGERPVFQTLVEQGLKPIFSTAFGRALDGQEEQSSLILGGIDTTKYTGDITYLPVSSTRWYWQAQLDSINVNGKVAVTPQNNYIKEAIIDTGSTLIAGPKADVDAFWSTVEGATYNTAGGYWAYPCASQLNASFSFTGLPAGMPPLQISNKDLNFGQVNALSDKCVGAIIEGNTSGYWILGLAFLKNYYTIFDAGNYQIGFATPTY